MEIEYKRVWGGDKSKAWSVGKYPSADAFVTPAKVSIYLPLSYDNRATELIGVDRGVNLHRFIYLYYSAHCEWNYAGGLNYVSEPVGKARKDQYLGLCHTIVRLSVSDDAQVRMRTYWRITK